ncbi:MAG TPA: endolytic transglycosylase MltG [Anaerolineae bacterium]|nr:endolytic transglycosylase MltG [Anaerolineae bacterium]
MYDFFVKTFPRFLLFVAVLAALVAVGFIARAWTQEQVVAYEAERPETGLVRNTTAAWKNLNPDNFETQALQFYLNLNREAIYEPVDPNGEPVEFRVELGETGRSISERLEAMGLIRDAGLFRLYLRLNNLEQKLEAGKFILSPAMTVPEIAEALQQARREDILVRIPEGRRAEEIAQILEEAEVIDAAEFMAAVRTGDLNLLGLPDYPLLRDKPPGASFEGYLFPDTYRFPEDATPADILRQMFDNLEVKIEDKDRTAIAASGRTFFQVLILASIVEREAVLDEERPLIASTYLNRLGPVCEKEVFGYLAADPTVQYAMGYDPDQDTWWPTVPDVQDYLEVNSPYNTYLYPGLPPGPIANPSLASIKAAIYPAQTTYCYFVATGDGRHVFSETGAEHELNVQSNQP